MPKFREFSITLLHYCSSLRWQHWATWWHEEQIGSSMWCSLDILEPLELERSKSRRGADSDGHYCADLGEPLLLHHCLQVSRHKPTKEPAFLT